MGKIIIFFFTFNFYFFNFVFGSLCKICIHMDVKIKFILFILMYSKLNLQIWLKNPYFSLFKTLFIQLQYISATRETYTRKNVTYLVMCGKNSTILKLSKMITTVYLLYSTGTSLRLRDQRPLTISEDFLAIQQNGILED